MIISRSADYGLRALIHLAQVGRDAGGNPAPESLERIAATRRIPPAILSKILQTLVKAGMLRSQKGYGGGFVLKADAASLTLEEVIQAIDGPFTVFECLVDDTFCELCGSCTMRDKFQELQDSMLGLLRRTTIADLVPHGGACRGLGDARGRRPGVVGAIAAAAAAATDLPCRVDGQPPRPTR